MGSQPVGGKNMKTIEIHRAPETVEQSLYEIRKTIHPRSVSGWFAGWRVALVVITQLVFYGTAWLQWNDRQAVLFDLVSRKFYILGLVLWPQDFIYLTALLVVSALSLFLFTAIAGRLWCGYACPQTVYTEIFMWIERKVEGDRVARLRLEGEPLGAAKLGKKALKHGLWIALALWTGFTFVGYFTPIRALWGEVMAFVSPAAQAMGAAAMGEGRLGPWETFWILFYSFATYGNAGWMREQVCKYMCPYARFQSAMFDKDTMIITYDGARGEPRGGRSRTVDAKAQGLGDCVDCGICVQVCPTGIDIRNGLQYECIGCAACIDGCNQVMKKMGYAPGLIRYSTENALREHWDFAQILRHMIRPRVLIYTGILGAVITAAATSLALRVPLKVDVIRDRTAMAREVAGGTIENIYQLQVMNTQEAPQRFTLAVSGLPGVAIASDTVVDVPAATTLAVPTRVRVAQGEGKPGSNRIELEVRSVADPAVMVRERTVFMVPR